MSGASGLGARWDGASTRFALYSKHATSVELCFYDHPKSAAESRRLELERTAAGAWSLDVEGAGPGTLYGYRVHGPHEPQSGHRFNPAKRPRPRAVEGEAHRRALGPGAQRLPARSLPAPLARVERPAASGAAPELAQRIASSPDLFDPAFKEPLASVNYVTSHDGFTLADLVSYERKHNEANGEDNRDGSDHDLSHNWGHEGPTDDPGTHALRERVRRSLVATLAFARGVPMIRHGDELGHTQAGNNNPYPQDNAIGWLDWAAADRDLLAFFRRAFTLRRRHGTLREAGPDAPLMRRLAPEGHEVPLDDLPTAFAVHLPPALDADAEPGPELLWLLNGTPERVTFALPAGAPWRLELATGRRRAARGPPRARGLRLARRSCRASL